MAHPAFAELIRSQDARAFSAHYAFNVSPVTDNAPFFFFTLKPEQVFRGLDRGGIDWKVNLGIAILGLVLVISVAAVLVFLVVPMLLSSEARSGRSVRLLYFIAIGLGYILVEIAFIQRFVLFLGNPTYALTVVVFLMLLSSGLGSVLSRRWFTEPTRVASAMAFIVAALVIYVFALPHLLEALVGLPFVVKLLLSALLLIPPGFAMGMPFPSGSARLVAAGFSPGECPGETRRRGMGVGHECCVERVGFGVGDGDCHPVRIECHAGLRRRGVCAGHVVAAHLQEATSNWQLATSQYSFRCPSPQDYSVLRFLSGARPRFPIRAVSAHNPVFMRLQRFRHPPPSFKICSAGKFSSLTLACHLHNSEPTLL